MSTITARNASFDDILATLQERNARRHDIVVPASKLRARNGEIVVRGAEAELTADGVTTVDGVYRPTQVFNEGLSDKLGIPQAYLNRTLAEAVDLFDVNVNSWLHGRQVRRGGELEVVRPADERSFLLRTLRGEDGERGIARALLSDKGWGMDDLDMLIAALEGIQRSGVQAEVVGGDITDRRMYLDVVAPEITAVAPKLLEGYRSPFEGPNGLRRAGDNRNDLEFWRGVAEREGQGYARGQEPIVFAGFRISNSEVGNGAASIRFRMLVKVCRNGLILDANALKARHLGSRLDEGVIDWSAETQRKSLELITAKTVDTVKAFLNPEYLAGQVAEIERKAGRPIGDEPEAKVTDVTKALGFTKAEQQGVLRHFLRGGQDTFGGLVNAVTSASQTLPDADRADWMDSVALKVLDRV